MEKYFSTIIHSLIIVSALLLSFVLVRNILSIVNVQKRIDDGKLEVEKLEKEQALLKQRLEIATSSAFLEKAARAKLGWGKEGEYIVVLPSEEFLKSLAPKIEEEKKPPKPNWQKWLKLFF